MSSSHGRSHATYKSCLSPPHFICFVSVGSHMISVQPLQCIHRGWTIGYIQYINMHNSISKYWLMSGIQSNLSMAMRCPLSTCPCIFLAGAGAATCPPSSWFPAPAEHAPWPAPGGQPVSAAVWGRGSCRRGGWPAGGAVVPEQCFLAAAPPKERPPGLGDLKGSHRRGMKFSLLCVFSWN